jgi:hypothetical protein
MLSRFTFVIAITACLVITTLEVPPAESADYLRLEILMDTDVPRLLQGQTPTALVRWETLSPHPFLSTDRARIALAALLYGRILFAHEETRTELFQRVQQAAEKLADGEPTFPVEGWRLQAGGMSFPIWPWRIVNPTELKSPKVYIATLIGREDGSGLAIQLDMASGLERMLAPASALIPLFTLSKELDSQDRRRLGNVLRAMNKFYETPERSADLLSEVTAFSAAQPLLVVPPKNSTHLQETLVSKKDADFVFSLIKSEWEKKIESFFAPGWDFRVTKFETGSMAFGFNPVSGVGLSIKPFYQNDSDPPDNVTVSNYFPVGALPPRTDEMKKDMEAAAQKDLGPTYSVHLIYSSTGEKEARALGLTTRIEVIEVVLTRKK